MSQLILNESFNLDIFMFEMMPPYVEEKQHVVQNGNLLTDIIAYKDRFQITWPYLDQINYNALLAILYDKTDPYIEVDYVTDSIRRLWDGSTAYTEKSAIFTGGTPVYQDGGVLSEMATTNLFTNPSGEDLSTTNLVAEDSEITITNTNEQYLFGGRSFKLENSALADYEPTNASGTRGYIASLFGPNSTKSLATSYGANNRALYTDFTTGNAADAVWTYSNITRTSGDDFPATLFPTNASNYMEQIVTTSIGNSYIYQVLIRSASYQQLTVAAYDSSTVLINSTTEWTDISGVDYKVLAVSFTATSVTTKVRFIFSTYPAVGTIVVSEIMLSDMTGVTLNAPYYSVFTGTDAAPVDDRGVYYGFAYDSTKSIYGAYSSGKSVKQSVFCQFKTAGWSYTNSNNKKYTLFSSVLSTSAQPDTEVFFLNNNLYIYHLGSNIVTYNVTSLDDDSWHSLCIVMSDDPSGILDTFKVYLDYSQISSSIQTSRMLVGDVHYTNNTGKFIIGNSAYYDGTWHNLTDTGVTRHFEGYISNFTVSQYEMDQYFSYKSDSLFNIFSTSYTFNNVILNNEEIAFFNAGDSEDSYVARTVYFEVSQDITDASASLHAYFENSQYKKLLLVGRADGLTSYNDMEFLTWYNNSSGYLYKTWKRLYLDQLTVTNFATFAGVFGLSVPIGETVYVDGIQVEDINNSTTYCDGDQDNCFWDGTANASTSSRLDQTLKIEMPTSLYQTYTSDFSVVIQCYIPAIGYGRHITNPVTNNRILFLGDSVTQSSVEIYYSKYAPNGSSNMAFIIYDALGNLVNTGGGNPGIINRDTLVSVVITKNSDKLDLYVEGTLLRSFDISGLQFQIPQYLYLGSNLSVITDINVVKAAIYNRSLTSTEVSEISACGGQPELLTNLLDYYNFDDSLIVNLSNENAINTDVRRLRKKVLRQSISTLKHVKNRANYYEVRVLFQES